MGHSCLIMTKLQRRQDWGGYRYVVCRGQIGNYNDLFLV